MPPTAPVLGATEQLETLLSVAAAQNRPAHWLAVLNAAVIAAEVERLRLARPDCISVIQGEIFFDWYGRAGIEDRVVISIRRSGLVQTSVHLHPASSIMRRSDHTLAGMLKLLRWAPIARRVPASRLALTSSGLNG